MRLLLTAVEAAAALGVSKMTVTRLVRSGELRPIEARGLKRHHRRFSLAAVQRLKRKWGKS